MLLYCLKCRKNTERKNPKVLKTKNGRRILLWICVVCDSKKSRFIKEQKASGLLSSSGIKKLVVNFPYLALYYIESINE